MAVEEAGLVPLDGPLPQPRLYDLLAGARQVPLTEDDHWLAGARLRAYPPGPAYTFDPCGTGTYRSKEAGGDFASPALGTVTVYLPTICTARSVGDAIRNFEDRAKLAFVAYEGPAVERFFATGDGHALLGPYLTDTNLEILNGGAAVTPTEGLALLEQEIATVGAGMIHVAPATATYWVSEYLIEAGRDGKMRTRLGTLVAVGAGYMDAYPDNQPGTPADDTEWAYATGAVEYRRDADITVVGDTYAQNLNRAQNEVTLLAERNYLLTWVGRIDSNDETNIQAGVLIDRQT